MAQQQIDQDTTASLSKLQLNVSRLTLHLTNKTAKVFIFIEHSRNFLYVASEATFFSPIPIVYSKYMYSTQFI